MEETNQAWKERMRREEQATRKDWPADQIDWTEEHWSTYLQGCSYADNTHAEWEKRSNEQREAWARQERRTKEDAEKYPWKYAVNLGPRPIHPPHRALWLAKFEDYQDDGLPKCESLSRALNLEITPEMRDAIWADYYNGFERRNNPKVPVAMSWAEIAATAKPRPIPEKKSEEDPNARPSPAKHLVVGDLKQVPVKLATGAMGKRIVCRVTIKSYPTGYDELVGRAFIADDSHVGMSVTEAAGSSDRTTVTDAKELHFILPISYHWSGRVKLMFYFRKENVMMKKSLEWWCLKKVPESADIPEKIMPDDPNYSPLDKALNWASETQHGQNHCDRWNMVAAALGADNGYSPMSKKDVKKWWKHHGQNARWSMALDAVTNTDEMAEIVATREAEMDRYHSKLSMQGHFSAEEWKARHNGADPIICKFEGYDELTIYDPGASGGMPNWWLDGPGEPSQLWRLEEDGTPTFVRALGEPEIDEDDRDITVEDLAEEMDETEQRAMFALLKKKLNL